MEEYSGYYFADDGSLTAEERREMTLVNLARSRASKAKRKKQRRQKAAAKKITEAERRAKEQQRIKQERDKRRTMSEANRRGAGMDQTAPPEPKPESETEFMPPVKAAPAPADDKSIDIALPGEKKPAEKEKPKTAASGKLAAAQPRAKVGRFSAAAASSANPNRITAGSAVMFGLLTTVLIGLVIYGRVQTNEAYTEIAQLQAEYDDLVAQNVSMKSEMEGKMTVKNIEDYAQNVLGLMPLNQSQIEYIQLQTEDEVVITQPKESFFVKVNDFLTGFWEFLSGS
ncbi:MAG: hypothetical protein IJ060_07195 [Oscillospiraceae bacterium]|nr:hypothetical protein [Oscillospiraceae bacterium]